MAASILMSSGDLTSNGAAGVFGTSLLNVGRQANRSGIGLSASARSGINGFINATQGGYNQLFSLATGPSLSAGGMATQINALRASIPVSQLSPEILQQIADAILEEEKAAGRGSNVDTTA